MDQKVNAVLGEKSEAPKDEGVTAQTWAVLRLESETLRDLLEHEDDFLDTVSSHNSDL
jgi:hypothetical protein